VALRIDTAVTRGEIDNTERGRVRARLWLIGRDVPVELDLDGDAWRDVAGTRVTFTNPMPKDQALAELLNGPQTGVAGDITASRKVKVFTVPEEEWIEAYKEDRIAEVPTEWRNSLYLEWFSTQLGRCVIESTDFHLTISPHVWQMDEDEEGAQKLANMQAMRDFLALIIQRPEPKEDAGEEDEDYDTAFTEEAWEKQLKASDRLTDASLEAEEKYGDDPDVDEKTAFVMGWDHILEDMADAEEGVEPSDEDSEDKKQRREWKELMNQAAAEVDENPDAWKEREPDTPHPLKEQARDFLMEVMNSLRASDLNQDRGDSPDHPLDRFVTNLMQMTGKLAGALYSRHDLQDSIHRGYILAITKRCLNWANEALAALNDLLTLEDYAPHRPLFETWREGVFRLRSNITDLREELREE